MDYTRKLKEIVSIKLRIPLEQIGNDSNFVRDLAADSLDIVELIITLEKEYKIEISDSEAIKLQTINLLQQYLIEKGKMDINN